MLQEPTRQYISNLGDEDLIEYIQSGTGMYESEAIVFAQQEFERRNLGPERIASLQRDAEARIAAHAADRAEAAARPLGTTRVILAFMGGCLGLPLILFLIGWVTFREHGEHRKTREMWICGFIGLGTAALLLVLVAIATSL